jgi:bisphosphoglycerate-independent phosphoglycerate mutase (AlkP superfamily)
MKYFILFYCYQNECKNAQDYIELSVFYTNKTNRSISERFYLSDVDQEYKWTEKSFEFLVTNQKETNLKVK